MQAFAYSNSPWPIRDDLGNAFRYTWSKLAAPGNWLTGDQRVQVAKAVRCATTCSLCCARKAALSPFAVEGQHDGDHGPLSDLQVDIVHRLTTDASRLTGQWVEDNAARGVSKPAYVEILSLVVSTIAIDSFHTALGFELEPLPEAQAGEPSGATPSKARLHGAWVPTVSLDDVDPEDTDIYQGMGRSANVITAMSLVPDAIRLLRAQSDAMYLGFADVANPANNGGRALSRPQIELLAGRVSALNDCFY